MPGVEALTEIPPLGRLCLCPEKGATALWKPRQGTEVFSRVLADGVVIRFREESPREAPPTISEIFYLKGPGSPL
jgi:hypothetical protein